MQFTIDLNKETAKLPHYWTKCVGSCHAATALREDWRKQLRQCREELGFEYVRFHGLLNDDMSVYKKEWDGSPIYCFYNIDSIFDFLLEIGMRPFVELSFMPEDMASGAQTAFHYKGNVTPPADYGEWAALVGALARHLVDRYGVAEVEKWFFEVWNEPNLDYFWAGTQREYFELYRAAAGAIKAVDGRLKVGGPATARNAWIADMKNFCKEQGVPLDFLSTHHYPTDAALGHDLNMEEQMARARRGICREMVDTALSQAGDTPLYYTEWNNSPSARDPYHDDPYSAAFIVKTIVDNIGLIGIYSFWTFTDIFEESGFCALPFHGGFGLMNIHGVPKPTYRAFQLLGRLGPERLAVLQDGAEGTVECAASRNGEEVIILVYNHNVPLAPIKPETVRLFLQGANRIRSVEVQRIDQNHANPKGVWIAMGKPEYLSPGQIRELLKASELRTEEIALCPHGDGITMSLNIEAHAVAAIILRV